MPQLRTVLLGLALIVTVLASVLDFPADETALPTPSGETAAPARRAAIPGSDPSALVRVAPREPFSPAAGDLFAARGWQAAPAPSPAFGLAPPAAAASAPASAPPLPFRYLGKLVHDGVTTAFLGQGNRTYMAREGDVLAGYRVEEITVSEMTFTHLQLNEKQRLTFGSAL